MFFVVIKLKIKIKNNGKPLFFCNSIVTGFEHGSQSNAWLNLILIKLTIEDFSEVLDVILLIGVQKEMDV